MAPLFHNIFNISLTSGVKLHIHLVSMVLRFIVFLTSAILIFRSTDISKCPLEFAVMRVDCINVYNK